VLKQHAITLLRAGARPRTLAKKKFFAKEIRAVAERRRLLLFSFLHWLEQTDIYKPVVVDGRPRAPERLLRAYEADSAMRGSDVRL